MSDDFPKKLYVSDEDWKWLEKYLAEDLRLEDNEHDSDNSCRKECQRQDGDGQSDI